ncbi:MAG: amidase [bacterium]
MKIVELTVKEIVEAIGNGQLSSVEVARAFLDRIDQLDSIFDAWVRVDHERVLAAAKKYDKQKALDRAVGKLQGVPIGFKDIFFTKGIPTTACSEVYKDFVPEYDARSVQLIKEAGGIMLGKTVTTEFAWTDPSSAKNPWNSEHTPGGSSSGSAVAVATKMCPAALGSQTVGSVLRPASYCGIVGFKPTFESVDRYGLIPFSPSSDTVGWMTRSVEDAAVLWEVLRDPSAKNPELSSVKIDDDSSVEGVIPAIRIGFIRDFFLEESDAETQDNFNKILSNLDVAGAIVDEVRLPKHFQNFIRDQKVITEVEGARFHRGMFEKDPSSYGPLLSATIESGLKRSSKQYSTALERQIAFKTDMEYLATEVDVLLTPSTPSPAPADLTTTGNGMFQGPWSACGLPALTLPSGLSSAGLPLGVQLIGRSFGDQSLLKKARWCETVLDIDFSPLT